MSTRISTMPTEICHGYLYSLEANIGIVPEIKPLQSFWTPFFGCLLQPLRCPGLLSFCLGVAQVI
jgi:hypothetical protein